SPPPPREGLGPHGRPGDVSPCHRVRGRAVPFLTTLRNSQRPRLPLSATSVLLSLGAKIGARGRCAAGFKALARKHRPRGPRDGAGFRLDRGASGLLDLLPAWSVAQRPA